MSEDIIILTNKGIIVTREEQIKHALSKYIKDRGVSGNHIVDVERDAAFISGALYADRNPDLSSLWHDASDVPEKNRYILIEIVITSTQKNVIGYYVEYTKNTVVKIMKTEGFRCRWAYVSDLLPKGGEK